MFRCFFSFASFFLVSYSSSLESRYSCCGQDVYDDDTTVPIADRPCASFGFDPPLACVPAMSSVFTHNYSAAGSTTITFGCLAVASLVFFCFVLAKIRTRGKDTSHTPTGHSCINYS